MGKPNRNTQAKETRTPEENEKAHVTGIPTPETEEVSPNIVVMREREFLCQPESVEEAMIEAARKRGIELEIFNPEAEAEAHLVKAERISKQAEKLNADVAQEIEDAIRAAEQAQKILKESQVALAKAQNAVLTDDPWYYNPTFQKVAAGAVGVGLGVAVVYGINKYRSNHHGSPEVIDV